MERFRISDRLQFGVHLASGNLWIDQRDLTVRGDGNNGNWLFNAGRDMVLDLSFSTGVFMPVDGGACAEFPRNADGTFGTALNGVRASLTKNAGNSYTVRYLDSGETWSYNPGGWLLNRADRNGNTITYYYNTDGSLASVADTQGRVTTFTNQDGHVTKVVDPSGTVSAEYTYDGNAVSLTYDADGNVAEVTTPRQAGAVDTLFAYDSDTQTTERPARSATRAHSTRTRRRPSRTRRATR